MVRVGRIRLERIENLFRNWRSAFPLLAKIQPSPRVRRRLDIGAGVIGAVVLSVGLSCGTLLAADNHAPQAQESLRQMLKITWKKGPSLPQGLQDIGVGIVRDTLISVGGFCSGEKDVPGKPDKYPRGFFKKVWGLNLSDPKGSWASLPDFPGAARQGLSCITVNQKLYCWGGWSYSEPFAYKDGYRLSKQGSHWRWDGLPELPSRAGYSGICAIGPKIYVFGGADYDTEKFYTHADRAGNNKRLGARLLVIDTKNLKSGWKRWADCPGTGRLTAAVAAVGGKIFVIGGGTGFDNPGNPADYNTVVDNWVYDPANNQWERIRDLPVASGNFPSGKITYKGRYIILFGGYRYSKVENPDGSLRQPYGTPYKHYRKGDPGQPPLHQSFLTAHLYFGEYFSDVWVYDTQTGLFGTADPLPLNNNMPITVGRDAQFYLIGGETGGSVIEGEYFGHHPDLLLIGKVKEIK